VRWVRHVALKIYKYIHIYKILNIHLRRDWDNIAMNIKYVMKLPDDILKYQDPACRIKRVSVR